MLYPPATPPRLDTPHLVLDAHGAADLDAFAAMWADLAVVRHISGQPSSRQESWQRLLRHRGHWAVLGYDFRLPTRMAGLGLKDRRPPAVSVDR